MRLPRRATNAILAALILTNLALRLPTSDHELGVDSFVWHGMATSLDRNDYARWILSPLSYVGLFPLSHPSGSPFLTVATSDLMGLAGEASILAMDLIIAVLGILVSFMLGWEFMRNSTFALLFAAVLSLTPEMLTALAWQMPTRIMFTTLLPLFLWGLIRLAREPARRNAVVAGTTFLLMMSFHRLTILVALVATAYVITGILLTLLRMLRSYRPSLFLRPSFLRRIPLLSLAAVAAVAAGTLLLTDVLEEYSVGVVASGDTVEIQLLNLAVSLARGSGLLLPLAFVGVIVVAFRRNKTIKEPFILVGFLVFIPMLFLRQYTSYYTVPFTALFIAFGLFALLQRLKSRRSRMICATAASAFLLVTSASIASYDLALTSHMSSETYNGALYLGNLRVGTVLTNEGLIGSRLHAISGTPYLPVGGATTAFQSPELLMFGFLAAAEVVENVVQIPPQDLTIDSDSLFVLPDVQAEADWVAILSSSPDEVPAQFARYNIVYAFESKTLEGSFTAYGNTYYSRFFTYVDTQRYECYEDGRGTIYFVGD